MDKIILRKYENKIIAFFPEVKVNPGMILSYAHIGQHSEASLSFYRETKPVKIWQENVLDLVNELKSLGYKPKIMKKIIYIKHREAEIYE